jgi:hypothetical protein
MLAHNTVTRHPALLTLITLAPLLASLITPAAAQQPGSIAGAVYGGSGVTIPNARVTATNVATQATATITAAGSGKFEFPSLAPGRYKVAVDSFGDFPELTVDVTSGVAASADLRVKPLAVSTLSRVQPITMEQLRRRQREGVSVTEVTDYVFGNYTGDFPSPPHADGNPKKALVITWRDFPYRFVFAHEGSYCPWFDLPSGSGLSYQFFEGNLGWAELFNNWGRKEHNSFVDVLEPGPHRVWVRWTYFGVNMKDGTPAYRATEDFWAYPNGLILRRQSYRTMLPGEVRGYAREPIEMIGLSPVGKLWTDVLARDAATGESHALAVLDPYSTRRYDVFWKPKPGGAIWAATPRRTGASWQQLDDAPGVALIVPMRDGAPFCIFGDNSGYRHDFTRIKEHSHKDTGGIGWISQSWDHWPIGWLNSQGHPVDAESMHRYPNHFSPAGMDFFALPDEEVERGDFYSLIGVGGATAESLESIRTLARRWLDLGPAGIASPDTTANLPAVSTPEK